MESQFFKENKEKWSILERELAIVEEREKRSEPSENKEETVHNSIIAQ